MQLLQRFIEPFKHLKKEYVPLLMVYFAYGFAGITAVTFTFIKKDVLPFTAVEWASIGIWASLPWSIKMVYGSMIDGITIFGSRRKSYIVLGSILMIIGKIALIDLITYKFLTAFASEYAIMSIGAFLAVSGTVMADIVADTMTVEVVPKLEDKAKYREELAQISILSRLTIGLGAVLAASITGWLAATFEPVTVLMIWFIIPVISCSGVYMADIKDEHRHPLDWKIFGSGLAFGIFTVGLSIVVGGDSAQLPLFIIALSYISFLMYKLTRDIPS